MVVCVGLAAGCSSEPVQKIQRVIPEKKDVSVTSGKVRDMEARLERLMQLVTYKYNPSGKPDPFEPFLKSAPKNRTADRSRPSRTKRPDHCESPLECMDVGQLTLVAIVSETAGTRVAMAQDASGIGYMLKNGLRIGYRNGVIKEILQDRIVVEEEYENIRGELAIRERLLFLHPEGK